MWVFILEQVSKTDAKKALCLGYGWGFAACASLIRLRGQNALEMSDFRSKLQKAYKYF